LKQKKGCQSCALILPGKQIKFLWPWKEISNLANKKIKPTGTAIGEFEFSVLAIRFFKILKYSAPYVPAAYFSVIMLNKEYKYV
jgi:hypothetical protein